MPCLSCGDQDRETCGCLPALLGRWKQPQRPGASSTSQGHQDRGSISMAQVTGPATSRTGTRQQASPRESIGRQAVRPAAALRGEGKSLRPAEAIRGEGSSRAPRGNPAGQRAVYLWPRTSGIQYHAQSGFATQQTILPGRQEGVQQDSGSSPSQRQPTRPAGSGQSSTSSGDKHHGSAGTGSAQPQPAGQEVANTLVLRAEPVTGRPPWPSLMKRRMGDYLIDVGFEIAVTIGPKSGQHYTATSEGFVVDLARNYNRQVPSQHPRMAEKSFKYDDARPSDEWSITILDFPTTIARQITLQPPAFVLSEQPPWQRDIQATWKFLRSQYKIQGDPECSAATTLNFDPDLNLLQQRRIAQAILHFKPVLQTLIPDDPVENPSLYPFPESRFGPISDVELMRRNLREDQDQPDAINDAVGSASSFNELMGLLWLADETDFPWYWIWITENPYLTMFQRPLIPTVADAIWWAEFRLSFILACVVPNAIPRALKIPRTFEGLREFLSGVRPPLGIPLLERHNPRRVRVRRPAV